MQIVLFIQKLEVKIMFQVQFLRNKESFFSQHNYVPIGVIFYWSQALLVWIFTSLAAPWLIAQSVKKIKQLVLILASVDFRIAQSFTVSRYQPGYCPLLSRIMLTLCRAPM